jgi:hypothetical protein
MQRIGEISLLQRAHAGHQILQRTREGMRDQKHQQAARQQSRQPESEQQFVEAAQECGRLIERLQHPQIQRRSSGGWQIDRGRQKPFLAQPDLIALRRPSSGHARRHAQQLRFLGRLESAAHDRVSIAKCDFAGRDAAQVAGHVIVDFVAQQQVSQNLVPARRAEINILEKNFVEVPFDIPPVPRGFARNNGGKKSCPSRTVISCGVACSAITFPEESASSSKSLPACCHKSREAS